MYKKVGEDWFLQQGKILIFSFLLKIYRNTGFKSILRDVLKFILDLLKIIVIDGYSWYVKQGRVLNIDWTGFQQSKERLHAVVWITHQR